MAWNTEAYNQFLYKNVDELVDWIASTVFIPYFERLPKELHQQLLDMYREKLYEKWPNGPGCMASNEASLFYPFKRTIILGKA